MLPLSKVQGLISKHSQLEKDLSSGNIDKNSFAEKSKEYSDLNEIIKEAKEYSEFDKNKSELENIINDANSDMEMKDLAEASARSFISISELASLMIFSNSDLFLSNSLYSFASLIISFKSEYSLDFSAKEFLSIFPEDRSFSN